MNMIKKIPGRRCNGCMQSFDKRDLIRVVRSPEGVISIDFTGKTPGRGAYLCKNPDCLKKAIKAKRIDRALETAIPDEVYGELEGTLSAYAK